MQMTITFCKNLDVAQRTAVVLEILAACKSLDILRFHRLIEDENLFFSTNKPEFIEHIVNAFQGCLNENIQGLIQAHSTCRLCFPKSRVVGFKDVAGKLKLGLIFQPLISNATSIIISSKVTDAVNVYNKDTYFAPANLSHKERSTYKRMMDDLDKLQPNSKEFKMQLEKLKNLSEGHE